MSRAPAYILPSYHADGREYDESEPHPVTAPAVEALLVAHENVGWPGILLEDGAVVVLTVEQMRGLMDWFSMWDRLLARHQR